MSQENVERLQAVLEGWDLEALKRGDAGAALSLLDREVIYEDHNLPDHAQETYRGLEGVMRATQRWLEPFEDLTIELVEVIGTGDHAVSVHQVSAHARRTGIDVSGQVAYQWTFREGKVIYFRSFRERDEALEAAGLSE